MRYLIELAKHNPWGFSLCVGFAVWTVLALFTDPIEIERPQDGGSDA